MASQNRNFGADAVLGLSQLDRHIPPEAFNIQRVHLAARKSSIIRFKKGLVIPIPVPLFYSGIALGFWWVFSTFFALHLQTALNGFYGRYNGLWQHLIFLSRLVSFTGNAVPLAALLGLGVPFVLIFLLFQPGLKQRIFWGLILGILIFGMITTLSRGPWIASLMALIILALFLLP